MKQFLAGLAGLLVAVLVASGGSTLGQASTSARLGAEARLSSYMEGLEGSPWQGPDPKAQPGRERGKGAGGGRKSGKGAGSVPSGPALLRNPRITTTTQVGCDPAADLADNRLDPRARQLLGLMAKHWRIRLSCVHSGHSYYVAGTHRVSNHSVWQAVDIDQVNGHSVRARNRDARAVVEWIDRQASGWLRPSEVGSPWPLGHRPFFSDDGHRNHLHVGYR